MTRKSIWRGVLIAVLSVALAAPIRADKPRLIGTNSGAFEPVSKGAVIGIVVAVAAVAVLAVVLIVHHKSHKETITGCVASGANGMSVTDEKDKRSYALSGNTAGVKPGDRMTLEGKRKDAGNALVFRAKNVAGDFGACQP